MHLLLRNSQVISPAENINGRFDILIVNGVINHMGVIWQHVREVMQYDLAGKIIVPGFFDMHVHFREPGQTHKEDISTGALAAAYGGVTGVLAMPNTSPAMDSAAVLNANYAKSKDNIVDVYNSACATLGRNGKEITNIDELVKTGALAITDDGSPVEDDELMKKALEKSAEHNIPIIQHCEIMSISNGGIMNEGKVSRELGVKGIPNASEYEIIKRDIGLVRKINNSRYHVQHISTKEGVELVRQAKAEGLNVTAEACPHHFVLTDEAIKEYGANAKMNPPLRTQDDVDAILEGIKDGTIDAICTDHAPHAADEKTLGLEKAPFGIIGLETSIGLTYTYLVKKGIISIDDMIYKMSINPRKILNLPQIKMQVGEKANFTILDLNKEWEVKEEYLHSKSKNSPFLGWKLTGKSVGILNNCKNLMYG
ncbi:MAG: dihydroorotase [Ignavibacteriae bacterium]|nr:MAG: dihydroorotase [Ignavibacteriota bacterium]